MEPQTALRPALHAVEPDADISRPLQPRLDLLARAFAIAPLGPPAAEALASLAHEHHRAAGSTVYTRHDRALGLWLVVGGRVSVGGWEAGEQWRQTHAVTQAQWLDAASAWLGKTFQQDAVAETDTVLLEFPAAAVKRACTAHAALAPALLALLAQRIGQLTETTHGLLSKDVLARCAGWLLASMDPATGTVRMTQRKRAIASQLGATPETFSRTLRQLRESGTIDVAGYAITVRDPAALQRLARGDAAR